MIVMGGAPLHLAVPLFQRTWVNIHAIATQVVMISPNIHFSWYDLHPIASSMNCSAGPAGARKPFGIQVAIQRTCINIHMDIWHWSSITTGYLTIWDSRQVGPSVSQFILFSVSLIVVSQKCHQQPNETSHKQYVRINIEHVRLVDINAWHYLRAGATVKYFIFIAS